ncbi:uncharacterized protein LOC131023678 isoform X2 [Salvia miltiorrhiza]|uniref:uncharacterized protein LOC131023678 isoform X2 n=1 Tax=Salvia miltiorrhiza TaxID=226208 RepID=UPI0025ABBEA7|nr:uncharacterized protein LOC131023678 isoform X2 [Salvia miltiorrhiza]
MRFTVLGRIAVQIMKSYFHDRDWNGDMFKLGDVNEFHMREFYVILLSASIFSGIGLFANPTGKVESLFTACGAVLSFIIAHCTKAATKIERLLFFMLAVLLGWATATPWLSQLLDVDMGFVAAIILAHCVGFLAFYTSSSTMYYHFQFLYIEALANCTYTIFITLSVTTAFFGGNSDHLQAFRYLMWCMVYVVAYSQEVVVRSRREVGDYLMDAIWLYPSLPAFVVQLMKELWRILRWLVVILYKALEKMSFTVLGRIAVQQLKSYFRDWNWNCKMFSIYAERHLKVVYFTMFCVSMSSAVGSLSYPTGNFGCLFTACGAVLSFIIFYRTVQWRKELWRILRRLVVILYKALEKMSLTVFGQIAFQLKSYFRDRNWNCKMFSVYTESHLKEVYFTMFCVSMSSAVGSLSYPTGNFGCLFTACGAVLSFIIFYRTVPWRKNKRFLFLMLSSLLGWATATPWLSWLLDVDTGFVAALILAHCIGFASFYISTHSRWYYYQFIPLDALVRCSYRIFITLYVTRATFGGNSDHLQAFRYLMWCMVYVAAYSLDVAIKLNRGDFNYMMHAIWLYPSLPAFVVQLIRELWRILRRAELSRAGLNLAGQS